MSLVPPAPPRLTNRRALGAAGAFVLLVGIAIAPMAVLPSDAQERDAYIARYAQDFELTASVSEAAVSAAPVVRDEFLSTPGPETFIAGGTNHDWAKLVLVYAGWPVTESNVTVITRWMRQENGADDWFNRNNPLNIGMGGYASYPDLQTAAQVVAKALSTSGMYRDIAAGFAASADTATIEYAIWASPWAGGHYAWGGHWHYSPVDVVVAPSSAWGR
jgi:hypothetical protein